MTEKTHEEIVARETINLEIESPFWTMHWPQDRYPDKPEYEEQFESDRAVAIMLADETLFLNSPWYEESWPEEAKKRATLLVNINDVFAWGVADAEPLDLKDIEPLYRLYAQDKTWGPAVWAIIKRREMPQGPVEKRITAAGIFDLKALQKEHNLRPNYYDNRSSFIAKAKYAAYSAWERLRGKEPMPYDPQWWTGWKEYARCNPEWEKTVWYEEAKNKQIPGWENIDTES